MTDTTIAQLKQDSHNRRKHNPRNIGMIVNALQEVGAARSIVIDEDNNILAGNGTIEAAQLAGIERMKIVEADGEEIIAVRRRGLTDEQKRRLAILDNRTAELADWDIDQLLADVDAGLDFDGIFGKAELDELLKDVRAGDADAEPQIDKAAELQEKWQTATGQLWACGEHKIICGDCTDKAVVERVTGGEKVDMILTDPPYGVNYEYDGYSDDPKTHEIFIDKLWDVLPEHNFMVITPGHSHLSFYFKKSPRSIMIWFDKTKQAPSPAAFLNKFDIILVFGKVLERYAWDVFEIQGIRGDGLRELHPCPKPAELFQTLIGQQKKAMRIYDPFSGSGTTIIACQNLGRRCRAVEISPAYIAVSLQRFQDATSITPTLIES